MSFAGVMDMTFSRNSMDLFSTIPQILIEDENTGSLLIYFISQGKMMARPMAAMGLSLEQVEKQIQASVQNQAEGIIHLREKYDKPVVGYTFASLSEPLQQALIQGGVPVFSGPERAVAAIRALIQYEEFKAGIAAA